MALEVSPAIDSVLDRVKSALPHNAVYESEVPQGVSPPNQGGLLLPYIVAYFGNPVRSARDHHIVGSRNDTNIMWVSFDVIAPTAKAAREVRDKLISALVDFKPEDAGPMLLEGQSKFSDGNNNAPPTAFYAHAWFTFRHNLSWT